MANVVVLPAEIVSKIAAGEVIERPSSVIKELVENSIDAGTGSIEIELKSSGKTFIKVKDTGSGMAKDDLDSLFLRHATSKIKTTQDLFNISSLGFRGEALYSICAVSDIILRTKTLLDKTGWEMHMRGNEKIALKPITMTEGTEIEVKELFYNTPARRKFLKSDTSELNSILDLLIPYTILFPKIRFRLATETKAILDLAPAESLVKRICDVLHLDNKDLIEESRDFKDQRVSIRLALGDINIKRTRKDMEFVFINSRPVSEKTISFHINDIYRLLLNPGVYPFFCVFISMEPGDIDVNVHPTKREVKIKNEAELIPLLRSFCENTLMSKSKAQQAHSKIFPEIKPSASEKSYEIPAPTEKQGQYGISFEENILLFKTEDVLVQKKDDLKTKLKSSRYLGNFMKKYLFFESFDSLLVIDQHASQERITFERLKNQIESHSIEIQQLLTPILVKLSPQELVSWQDSKETLNEIGFQTNLWDKETLAIHSHPQLITDPQTSIRTLLQGDSIAKCDTETIARRACRSSVMTGFVMNPQQAEYQKEQLLLCTDPFICPHGRPTIVEIQESMLSKQFLRK